MLTFSEPVTDEIMREAVRAWVALLGEDRYEEALDMLYQGPGFNLKVPAEYGGRWTPDLLREVVRYYGLFECQLYEGYDDEPCEVVPVTDEDRALFEKWLRVDWVSADAPWGFNPKEYAGIVHVDLPLDLEDMDGRLSDLTVRLHIRRVRPGQLALELYDCLVM